MNILLINPNRFKSPPVPPIGLEYLSGSLEMRGDKVKILDLCFSENIFKDIDRAVKEFEPDFAGITIRNIDSVLYLHNEFFLKEIKEIAQYLKKTYKTKVILGGVGLLVNPQGILEYIGADYAFVGPAEEGIHTFLKMIENDFPIEKIYYSNCRTNLTCPRLSSGINYRKYYQEGGIAGFETHRGCSSSCVYCLEANSRVTFKRHEDIFREIKVFVDAGYDHIHLCDTEFNEDLDFSIEFCSALKKTGMDMHWTVYMKPANYNNKLFRLMKSTGVYLITLTVDSYKKCSLYWSDVEKIIFIAKSAGITTAVDFLAGFPYEDERTLIDCLDLFRRTQPDMVNINTFIRLYKPLQITEIIMKDRALYPYLLGHRADSSMVTPLFYNHVGPEKLKELIQGDTLFRIAGMKRGVNYNSIEANAMKSY